MKLKGEKFEYRIGKVTPGKFDWNSMEVYRCYCLEKLQPNSTSECYIKTNEELLNKLRSMASKVTPTVSS